MNGVSWSNVHKWLHIDRHAITCSTTEWIRNWLLWTWIHLAVNIAVNNPTSTRLGAMQPIAQLSAATVGGNQFRVESSIDGRLLYATAKSCTKSCTMCRWFLKKFLTKAFTSFGSAFLTVRETSSCSLPTRSWECHRTDSSPPHYEPNGF